MRSVWPAVSLLACVVACGDDGAGELPDAPMPPDSEVLGDAPPGGSITVTAWAGNAVRDPNAIVLFQGPGGSTIHRVMTDANGVATGEVPAGGMVTVIQGDTITTIVQVGGGDEIAVGNNVMATTGNATVTLPAAPGGTTDHQVLAPCGFGSSTNTSVPFALSSACPQPATVVAVARAGVATNAFLVESASITAGNTTTLTGTWATPVQFNATFANLPASVTRAVAYAGSRVGTSTVYMYPSELPPPSGGATSGSFAVPPTFGDGTELRYFIGQGVDAYQMVSETVAGARTSHTFDTSNLLPWIQTKQETGNGVTWTQSSGDAYDGAIATIEFQYKNSTQLTWVAILPESARGFTMPPLPPDIELPKQANQLEVQVELVEGSAFDYADMREMGGTTSFRRDETMPAIRSLRWSTL